MGYNTAEALVRGSQKSATQLVHLAEVTSLDNKKRARVRFYGEDAESGKAYTYIDGYIPEVGDKVLMLGQGNTYIIIGAVVEEEVVVKYALKDHNHDSVYVKVETFNEHTHSKMLNGKKSLEITSGGAVVPADTSHTLGTSALTFAEAHIVNAILDYLTIGGMKLEKEDIISKLIASGNDDYYVILDATALVPYINKGISLGTSSKMFKNIYAEALYINGKQLSASKLVSSSGRELELSGDILTPSTSETIELGSASKRFLKAYSKHFYGDAFYIGNYTLSPSKVYSNSRTDRYVEMVDNTFKPNVNELFDLGNASYQFNKMYVAQMYLDGRRWYPHRIISDDYPDTRFIEFNGDSLMPNSSKTYNIGTSNYQYKAVYSQNVYVNGSAVTTSDKRQKKSIKNLTDKYLKFFEKLRPVTFKYKKGTGTSNRTHAGFIAQEVEKSMQECGITNEEFGGLVIQENGEYGLRYEEFIAIQTAIIQDLLKRVEKLERRVKV